MGWQRVGVVAVSVMVAVGLTVPTAHADQPGPNGLGGLGLPGLNLGPTLGGPSVGASPNPLAFGSVDDGTTVTATLTLTNRSLLPAFLTASIQGDSTFALPSGGDTCRGSLILGGSSCTVGVTFAPTYGTSYAATVSVTGGSAPVTIPVSGTGVALSDWQMAHGTAQHRGQTMSAMPTTASSPLWSISDTGYSLNGTSPVVGPDGTIYLVRKPDMAFGVRIDAISGRTHQILWTWNDPEGNNVSLATTAENVTPAIGPDSTLYVTGHSGWKQTVLAIGPGGTLRWRLTGINLAGSPTVGPDGTVYVTDMSENLYAIDPATGHVLWNYNDPVVASTVGAGFESVAVSNDGGTLYLGRSNLVRALVAGRNGGRVIWTHTIVGPPGGSVVSSPAVGADGTIYVGTVAGSAAGEIEAINPDGSSKWTYSGPGSYPSTPVVTKDGRVVAGDTSGTLVSLSQASGAVGWTFQAPAQTASSGWGPGFNAGGATVSVDGNTYISNATTQFAVDANGALLWSVPVPNISLFSASTPGGQNTVLVTTNDSLIAY